jgi:hypothetical protein
MNLTERKMISLLKELMYEHAVVGVKAEFEAEGTRTEELMRLKEICLAAKIPLTLKIGGCEALRDMYDARAVGVDNLVAPMVETPFALRKYLKAISIAFPEDEQEKVDFLINVETIQTVMLLNKILEIPEIGKLDGIVLGRSDLIGSMGLDKKEINGKQVLEICRDVFRQAKKKNLICVIGGTISINSLPFLSDLSDYLDRFETRKVCFACKEALRKDPVNGINKALDFELLWLQNKKNYYRSISVEDHKRIMTLKDRGKKS